MTVRHDRPTVIPLTTRQAAILAFVGEHFAATACWPTVREIGDRFGIVSPNGVMCHVKALLRKGQLEQAGVGPGGNGQSRGFRLPGVAGSPALDLVVRNRLADLARREAEG